MGNRTAPRSSIATATDGPPTGRLSGCPGSTPLLTSSGPPPRHGCRLGCRRKTNGRRPHGASTGGRSPGAGASTRLSATCGTVDRGDRGQSRWVRSGATSPSTGCVTRRAACATGRPSPNTPEIQAVARPAGGVGSASSRAAEAPAEPGSRPGTWAPSTGSASRAPPRGGETDGPLRRADRVIEPCPFSRSAPA